MAQVLIVTLASDGGISTSQVVKFDTNDEGRYCLSRFKDNSMIHAFALDFQEN